MAIDQKDQLLLEKTPIREAIVNFYCTPRPGIITADFISESKAAFAENYPVVETLKSFKSELRFDGEDTKVSERPERRDIGIRLMDSNEPKQVLQFRENGFSFNRLPPYDGFENYRSPIARGWEFYLSQAQPTFVEKLGMRFINRLELPLGNGDVTLADYITVIPSGPTPGGFALSGFFQTLLLSTDEVGLQAQVTVATEEPAKGILPVVVDIEATCITNAEPRAFSEFETTLGKIRNLKNSVFRDTLTKKCLSHFQQQ